MAAGPIMWGSINQYAPTFGMSMPLFSNIIRAMDDAYLSHKAGDSKTFTREMLKR